MQLQKQPFWRVLRKRCSENMLQISRRTPMLKFKQSNFIEITLQHGCFPVNLLHIFRIPFLKDTSGELLLQLKFKKVTNLHFSQTKENLHLSLIDNGYLPVLHENSAFPLLIGSRRIVGLIRRWISGCQSCHQSSIRQ